MCDTTNDKVEVLLTSVKDLTTTQTALIDSVTSFKQQTGHALSEHSGNFTAISESMQKLAEKLGALSKAFKEKNASSGDTAEV
jgi:uncharacterized protein YukE